MTNGMGGLPTAGPRGGTGVGTGSMGTTETEVPEKGSESKEAADQRQATVPGEESP